MKPRIIAPRKLSIPCKSMAKDFLQIYMKYLSYVQANNCFGVLLFVFAQYVSYTACDQFHDGCARQGAHLLSTLFPATADVNSWHLLWPYL